MAFNENLISFRNAKNMLDIFAANGGDVDNLKNGDREYDYIKNIKAVDENGNFIDLETRFKMLNHPREKKVSRDVKQALIEDITDYRAKGGSFHIERKKLPFYQRLYTYTRGLRKTNPNINHEKAMKDLGFKEYSDLYYRCLGLEKLKDYRDEEGYVDSYRTNAKTKAFVQDLSSTLGLPYYLIVTLICDEKLKKCSIFTEYVELVKQQLIKHLEKFGTLKGLKKQNKALYEKFNLLVRYYSDGTEVKFSKEDWLIFFGLEDAEHRFINKETKPINIDQIMFDLKEKYGNKQIKLKGLDRTTYHNIIRKAVRLGISVDEVFAMYGLICNGVKIDRLSKVYTNKIPYLNEMFARRNELMKEIDKENLCKEEIFEHKVRIVKIVYEEFKNRIYNFNLNEIEEQL